MNNFTKIINKIPKTSFEDIYHDVNFNFTLAILVCTSCVLYLGVVRYLRYKNLNYIIEMYPDPQEILDNGDIAKEVLSITFKKEFPFMARQGTELALFKTYTIPTISKILAATGEFSKNCPRRTEDTELIVYEMLDACGRIKKQLEINPNTPKQDIDAQWKREQEAVERLNYIHSKYPIKNDDYIYTASLFLTEALRWINRYEWRKMDVRESNALFRVWYDLGASMKIKDFPDTPEKLIQFKNSYAEKKIKYSPSNWKCGEPTTRHLLSRILPSFLQEQGYQFALRLLPSILDPEDTIGFGLPFQESKMITWAVDSFLGLRALVIRYLMLPRATYACRTPFYANEDGKFVPEYFIYKPYIYKDGYIISELGPEKFLKQKNGAGQCPFAI